MGPYWRNMISLVVALSSVAIIIQTCRAHGGDSPDDYVPMHNCIRKVLGLPPLKFDPELAKIALDYAKERKDCAMIHSTHQYGENLSCGHHVNISYAVQMWLDERLDYDYDKNECIQMCGHYTQIVWKNTERVGCGTNVCEDGQSHMVVCNYDPPGNYVGQKPY